MGTYPFLGHTALADQSSLSMAEVIGRDRSWLFVH